MKYLRRLFLSYHPRYIHKSLIKLKEAGLYNRLIFVLLMGNAALASSGYVTASIGITFGKEIGTSLLAIIALGYQFSKVFLPLFRTMSLSKIMKISFIADIISLCIVVISLLIRNDALLFIGWSLVNIATISISIAYGNAIQKYMARDELRMYITKYNYTLNTLDIILKLIISISVGVISLYIPIIGVVICALLLLISLKYQLKFMKEVKENGF